jgi:hypothetical protein
MKRFYENMMFTLVSGSIAIFMEELSSSGWKFSLITPSDVMVIPRSQPNRLPTTQSTWIGKRHSPFLDKH